MKNLSLTKKFAMLLSMFVAISVVVLLLLIKANDASIDFGKKEKVGNAFQAPIQKLFYILAKHKIAAQRSFYENSHSQIELGQLTLQADEAFSTLSAAYAEAQDTLQLTEAGLSARKREHVELQNITKEWQSLKVKVREVKPSESNELHNHIISDLRTLIAHSGDLSNLILDPDLDSYYVMDITLLALPQTQDRIQNAIVDIEPMVRQQALSHEDRIKASVLVAMMREADLARIEGDFATALHEDLNFYGKSDTLETNIAPVHSNFVTSYGEFIHQLETLASGKLVPADKFISTSEKALQASFNYSDVAMKELDQLIDKRIATFDKAEKQAAIWSLIGILACLAIAYYFMKYLTQNLRRIVETLNLTSEHVSEASAQSATSSSTLSDSSNQQAASLQQTMASVEQISAMVSKNAESAGKTLSVVEMNQIVSENGSTSIDQMLDAIRDIKETNEEILYQMESSNKQFSEIVKIISEIGNKTTVINEIVFQTKILSFNASVEAARAGEHGKGFAVVAEEVGNLAQMSGNAAKEITDMLAGSIKKVDSIVVNTRSEVDRLIDIGRNKIVIGQTTAEKCREALNKITENAQTVSSMIADIAQASKEQAQGVHEINKAMSQLDQVTQQNSLVAQQSSAQSDELHAEADNLKQAVNKLTRFVDGKKSNHIASKSPELQNIINIQNHRADVKKTTQLSQKHS